MEYIQFYDRTPINAHRSEITKSKRNKTKQKQILTHKEHKQKRFG